ncbi:MerR family transcriptional regulator [Streptomyces sp. MBT49]|uniref:MerR family transcriptional regulator n=1 Tax=unclassified Streptomyces TaxID=2593676 RepID=UPI00190A622A|nr:MULTISPECIES: MerR family transcriptional regulator [unclassified Streptomyces]MBK3630918.1 MerR family transcriptional regulator [Streptomyces sp. MBT49]MBK3637182.1 MerR family transcriptional regulator [Streptomyces sp. MBT97]
MDLTGDLHTTLWTAAEAAEAAGVSPNVVRNWKYRGHLAPARTEQGRLMRNSAGQPLYRAVDVVRAEGATRERARRRHTVPAQLTA